MINHTLREIYKQKVIKYYGFTIDNYMALDNDERDLLIYNYLNLQKEDVRIQIRQEIEKLDMDFNKVIEREHQMKDKVKMLLKKRG